LTARGIRVSEPDIELFGRPIPSSGDIIPAVGLGTWNNFDVDLDRQTFERLKKVLVDFYTGGGRVIDASPMYGRAEAVVGALSADLQLNNGFSWPPRSGLMVNKLGPVFLEIHIRAPGGYLCDSRYQKSGTCSG